MPSSRQYSAYGPPEYFNGGLLLGSFIAVCVLPLWMVMAWMSPQPFAGTTGRMAIVIVLLPPAAGAVGYVVKTLAQLVNFLERQMKL